MATVPASPKPYLVLVSMHPGPFVTKVVRQNLARGLLGEAGLDSLMKKSCLRSSQCRYLVSVTPSV